MSFTHYIGIVYTCSFDALIQIIATSFAESEHLCNQVIEEDVEEQQVLQLAKALLKKNWLVSAHHSREKILLSFKLKRECVLGTTIVDSECTVQHMIKIMRMVSYIERVQCRCGEAFNRNFSTIPTSEQKIASEGLQALEEYLNGRESYLTCSCTNRNQPEVAYRGLLLIFVPRKGRWKHWKSLASAAGQAIFLKRSCGIQAVDYGRLSRAFCGLLLSKWTVGAVRWHGRSDTESLRKHHHQHIYSSLFNLICL